jgi:hypothetical protein
VRLAKGSVRGLAISSLLLAGCEVMASLDGLSGSQGTGMDASDSSTVDVQSEGPWIDAPALDSTHPDSAGVTDSAATDSAHTGADSSHPEASTTDSSSAADSPAEAQVVDAGSVYASTVLADTPLAYWRVDETSGTVAHDASGNGNDAQYTGGVTLGSGGALIGDPDTAARLDGVTGHLDVGNRFGFTGNAQYTLEIWAQPNNINTNYQRLFSRELSTSPREGYLVFARAPYAADPSTFSIERWANNQTNQCPQTSAITQVWHHFVATYDGSTSRIYLDGVLAASQPASLPLNATSASLFIGASAFDMAGYFNGVVDEVAVYGTALPAARIAAHFHASGR